MKWFIDEELIKTKEGCITLLEEIKAYKELDGQDFDFGTGLITNEMSYGREDVYYERAINYLESRIEFWDEENTQSASGNKRVNRYKRNRQHKNRLWKDVDKDWKPVFMNGKWNEEGTYPKRYYRGERSAYLKRQSNKKIRRHKGPLPPKGNTPHKLFDFWWNL